MSGWKDTNEMAIGSQSRRFRAAGEEQKTGKSSKINSDGRKEDGVKAHEKVSVVKVLIWILITSNPYQFK